MPVTEADNSVRLAVFDVLSNFLSTLETSAEKITTLQEEVTRRYGPGHMEPRSFHGVVNGRGDIGMRGQHLFLFLEPIVDEGVVPLLTLESSCDWVPFRLFVLLAMFDECNNLQTLAMRFETDEGGSRSNSRPGLHDFCHVQLCRRINDRTPASTPHWLPESQPSIPLDAEDQVDLVIAMLTSLYGGRYVFDKLNGIRDRSLDKYLARLRAFRILRQQGRASATGA